MNKYTVKVIFDKSDPFSTSLRDSFGNIYLCVAKMYTNHRIVFYLDNIGDTFDLYEIPEIIRQIMSDNSFNIKRFEVIPV